MSKKINLRDRVEDGEIDLSMSDLQEVPVRDIAAVKKATSLDLSNNRLVSLGKNFAQLTFLIKLDLSKNQLKSLPDSFGDLVLLKHLDLYSNQLNHLPLSFGNLKNLKWLDLKNNPLVPPLAEVAGPCQDNQQCQQCAKKVVKVIGEAKQKLEEEQKRVQQLQREKEMAEKAAAKKEQQQQQKNKKAKQNEKKKNQENGVKNHNEHSHDSNTSNQKKKDKSNRGNAKSSPKHKPQSKCATFCWLFFLLIAFTASVFGFLYVVDVNKYVQIRDGAGQVWNRTVELLPTEVVTKGKQAVEYVRPTAELAFGKVYSLYNSTSTFLNTDPRVKDHWNNIKDISSVICERLIDYLRTVYTQVPVFYQDVKNKIFQ